MHHAAAHRHHTLSAPLRRAARRCRYLAALWNADLKKEYCVLEAIGMAFLAEDMQGLTQPLRTLHIELVMSLVVYATPLHTSLT